LLHEEAKPALNAAKKYRYRDTFAGFAPESISFRLLSSGYDLPFPPSAGMINGKSLLPCTHTGTPPVRPTHRSTGAFASRVFDHGVAQCSSSFR